MGEKLNNNKKGGGGGEGGGVSYLTFLLLGTACVLATFVSNLTSFTEKIFMGRFALPPLYWLLCSVQVLLMMQDSSCHEVRPVTFI